MALVDEDADGGDLLLDAPDVPSLAPQDLLLEAVHHRLVELPDLVQVPQSRPVWKENVAMQAKIPEGIQTTFPSVVRKEFGKYAVN